MDRAAARKRDLVWITRCAIDGGADVIQLRDKTASIPQLLEEAKRLRAVTRAAHVPLIINDHVDVAVAVGAEGVHLGQEDLPVSVARTRLGKGTLIGKSTHSLEQAVAADQEALDYLAVGPLYSTPTKPDSVSVGLPLIQQVRNRVSKPIVTIGGIDPATLPDVLAAGATCVAVVRAVCGADDPQAAAENLKRTIRQFSRTADSRRL